MCSTCGYYFQGEAPPDHCPSCSQSCVFNDVTCYRPECGGEQNIDPLLVGAALKTVTGSPAQAKARTSPILKESWPFVDVLTDLTDAQKKKVRSIGRLETYEAGATIVNQGNESYKLYIVEEGQVGIQPEYPKGIKAPVTTVSRGGSFGWSSLVPPYRHMANAIALTKAKVLGIEREKLLPVMHEDPELGCSIMQNIASIIATRLRNLELEMVGLIQGNL